MILDSAEERCTLEVLRILEKKKVRYSVMFKQTKVSHTTLQNVLKYLLGKEFVLKDSEGYEITKEGQKFLKLIQDLYAFTH